jgi:hypothetical protein
MADSIRTKIINKIATGLQAIRIDDGYQTDAGLNVFKAVRPGLTVPSLVVVPQLETVSRTAYKTDEHVFPIRIEGLIGIDETTEGLEAVNISEVLYSDIVVSISAISWETTDPVVSPIRWTGGGVDTFPESREDIVGVVADFEFVFETLIHDPFNQ